MTKLRSLSFVTLFGTLIAAALLFPTVYDWRVHVISTLTSPRSNPQGCWLPAVGIMVAMLLALPFADYVARRLRAITPRLAQPTGLAFALGFALMFFSMAAQFAQLMFDLRWLHEFLARASAGSFIVGMLGCCVCALKDRLRCFEGQSELPAALAFCWVSLPLLLIGSIASIGALILLGDHAGQVWASNLRHSFRHTILWQLAFWEWIGAVAAYAFLIGSVLLLPVSSKARRKTGPATNLAESSLDSLMHGPRRTL